MWGSFSAEDPIYLHCWKADIFPPGDRFIEKVELTQCLLAVGSVDNDSDSCADWRAGIRTGADLLVLLRFKAAVLTTGEGRGRAQAEHSQMNSGHRSYDQRSRYNREFHWKTFHSLF
jgi:hypothetical protein